MRNAFFNDNDNVISREISNDNDNVKYADKYQKSKKVDMLADQLVQIFNNPNARRYYCKVANKLPESVIFNNVEATKQKGVADRARLFTYLCEKAMN